MKRKITLNENILRNIIRNALMETLTKKDLEKSSDWRDIDNASKSSDGDPYIGYNKSIMPKRLEGQMSHLYANNPEQFDRIKDSEWLKSPKKGSNLGKGKK